jgi:hypothetical protein
MIQAIKLIRAETGLDLKEAKDAADGLSGFQAGFPSAVTPQRRNTPAP